MLAAAVICAAIAIVVAQRGSDGEPNRLDELAIGDCFIAPDTALFAPDEIEVAVG